MFLKQTRILALLSTIDRAITQPAERWTPPVSEQLIVWLDVCTLLDTSVKTTALSAHSHLLIRNQYLGPVLYYRAA